MASPASQRQLSELGCSETLVRVSSVKPTPDNRGLERHFTPVEWQAIVKHMDATKPWAVAVRKDPDEAERDAKALFVSMYDKPTAVARLSAERKAALVKKIAAVLDEEDLI